MSQLIDNLQNKIAVNTNALSYVSEETPKTQADIDLFGPTVVKIDSDIISLVSQINSLKTEIVSLSTNAFNVGCGTTVGVTTVFPDRVVSNVPNYSISTYNGDDPYGTNSSSTLSSSNVGIGSFLLYTQSDTSQSGIGSLFASTSTCFRPAQGCSSGINSCVSFASSITALQSRIVTLQAQVSSLIPKSNAIKIERSEYEIARYGYNQTTKILTDRNTQIGIAISCIKDTLPTA